MFNRIILMFFLAVNPASSEIYRWVDKDGNVHFSDKQSANKQANPVQLKSRLNSFKAKPGNQDSKKRTSNSKLPELSPKQVIMYSTEWCGFCKKAKSYFNQNGISFSERDIEKSKIANKEYKSYGGGGVPLILVGSRTGTQKLSGFSITRFNSVYH